MAFFNLSPENIASLHYITQGRDQIKVLSGRNDQLSDTSLDIIESILQKQINIIVGQGPLNITPLVSILYAINEKKDVIVLIPPLSFQDQYKNYQKIFFSLLFTKYINNNIETHPFFLFEQDILFCKGELDVEGSNIKEFIIETSPVHGKNNFKNEYKQYLENKLKSRKDTSRKIAVIPSFYSIPAGIINNSNITFEQSAYNIEKLSPGLIIIESINERPFDPDALFYLIEQTKNQNIKLVLHFSWPYVPKLQSFLNKISEFSELDIAVYHFGKVFCKKISNQIQKPRNDCVNLSFEGELWDDVYYPSNNLLKNLSIIFPNNTYPRKLENQLDYLHNGTMQFYDSLRIIRRNFSEDLIAKTSYLRNIIKFPPIIDSFLSPSETLLFSHTSNNYRFLPLNLVIESLPNQNSSIIQSFFDIIYDLDKARDIKNELLNLPTCKSIRKKTLLQSFLLNLISTDIKEYFDISRGNFRESNTEEFILSNFNSKCGTNKAIANTIRVLFEALETIVFFIHNISIEENEEEVWLTINENPVLLAKNKKINLKSSNTINDLLNRYSPFFLQSDLNIEDGNVYLKIFLPINSGFNCISGSLGFECFNDVSVIKIELLRLVFYKDGVMEINSVHKINTNFGTQNDTKVEIILVGNNQKKIKTLTYKFEIQSLENLSKLPPKKAKTKNILFPGPLPFFKMEGDQLVLGEYFDIFLLPFKKILFFCYPGFNGHLLLTQIKVCNDLLSSSNSPISNSDLKRSITYNKFVNRIPIPAIESDISDNISDVEISPLNSAIKAEYGKLSSDSDTQNEDFKTLSNIWKELEKKPVQPTKSTYIHNNSSGHNQEINKISINVEFSNGVIEKIYFKERTLIRKKGLNDELDLVPIEDLIPGDQIFYIGTEEKETVDNYLLNDFFSERDSSLERILEPLTALSTFYTVISNIPVDTESDPEYLYNKSNMGRLHWLNEDERYVLFSLAYLLTNYDLTGEDILLDYSQSDSFIWRDLINPQDLNNIFNHGQIGLS